MLPTQMTLSMKQVCEAICQQFEAFVLTYHISNSKIQSTLHTCALYYADLLMANENGKNCMAFALFHLESLHQLTNIIDISQS